MAGGWIKLHSEDLRNLHFTQILKYYHITKCQMDGTCSMHVWDEKCLHFVFQASRNYHLQKLRIYIY